MNALLSKVGQHTIHTVDIPDKFSNIGWVCSMKGGTVHMCRLFTQLPLFAKMSTIVIGMFADLPNC